MKPQQPTEGSGPRHGATAGSDGGDSSDVLRSVSDDHRRASFGSAPSRIRLSGRRPIRSRAPSRRPAEGAARASPSPWVGRLSTSADAREGAASARNPASAPARPSSARKALRRSSLASASPMDRERLGSPGSTASPGAATARRRPPGARAAARRTRARRQRGPAAAASTRSIRGRSRSSSVFGLAVPSGESRGRRHRRGVGGGAAPRRGFPGPVREADGARAPGAPAGERVRRAGRAARHSPPGRR